MGSDGEPYRQGATFDGNGNFRGRTDVTDHGRTDHASPHHRATGAGSHIRATVPVRGFVGISPTPFVPKHEVMIRLW
jgi:hypothetical protein